MARKKIVSTFPDPGRTQQHFKEECDVNNIVKRFAQTGVYDHVAAGIPRYAHCSSQSFTEAKFMIAEINSHFERLPAETRRHFENDPEKFVAAHEDPERRDELVELGLAEPLPESENEPDEAPDPPVADPPPEAAPESKTEAN